MKKIPPVPRGHNWTCNCEKCEAHWAAIELENPGGDDHDDEAERAEDEHYADDHNFGWGHD